MVVYVLLSCVLGRTVKGLGIERDIPGRDIEQGSHIVPLAIQAGYMLASFCKW